VSLPTTLLLMVSPRVPPSVNVIPLREALRFKVTSLFAAHVAPSGPVVFANRCCADSFRVSPISFSAGRRLAVWFCNWRNAARMARSSTATLIIRYATRQGGIKILGDSFAANKLPAGFQGGNTSSSRTHKGVKHDAAWRTNIHNLFINAVGS